MIGADLCTYLASYETETLAWSAFKGDAHHTSHSAMQHKEFASLTIFKKRKEEESTCTSTKGGGTQ